MYASAAAAFASCAALGGCKVWLHRQLAVEPTMFILWDLGPGFSCSGHPSASIHSVAGSLRKTNERKQKGLKGPAKTQKTRLARLRDGRHPATGKSFDSDSCRPGGIEQQGTRRLLDGEEPQEKGARKG
jgi:hypothetical protein